MILLLIVAVAGLLVTDYLGNKFREEIIGEIRASTLTLHVYVSDVLSNLEGAVKALAGSPWISPALLSKGDQDIEHANITLDRYNSAIKASVTYLMDADGMTVASSEIFYTLKEAQVLIEEWRLEYNTFRPHSSLKNRPPAPEAWLH